MKPRTILTVLLLACVLFPACEKKEKELNIQFDSTNPLSLAPDVSWALVTVPYVTFRAEMSWNADTNGYCRKGEVLQVTGKSTDEKKTVWFRFADGWIPGDSLEIFSNRYKAEAAAKKIREQ